MSNVFLRYWPSSCLCAYVFAISALFVVFQWQLYFYLILYMSIFPPFTYIISFSIICPLSVFHQHPALHSYFPSLLSAYSIPPSYRHRVLLHTFSLITIPCFILRPFGPVSTVFLPKVLLIFVVYRLYMLRAVPALFVQESPGNSIIGKQTSHFDITF